VLLLISTLPTDPSQLLLGHLSLNEPYFSQHNFPYISIYHTCWWLNHVISCKIPLPPYILCIYIYLLVKSPFLLVKTSFLPFSLTISHGFHAKSRDPTLFDQVSEKSQRVDFVTAAHSTEALHREIRPEWERHHFLKRNTFLIYMENYRMMHYYDLLCITYANGLIFHGNVKLLEGKCHGSMWNVNCECHHESSKSVGVSSQKWMTGTLTANPWNVLNIGW
jgi:hypothetical protein